MRFYAHPQKPVLPHVPPSIIPRESATVVCSLSCCRSHRINSPVSDRPRMPVFYRLNPLFSPIASQPLVDAVSESSCPSAA